MNTITPSRTLLQAIRYPGEQQTLWVTLTLSTVLVLFLSAFDLGLAAVFVLICLWIGSFLVRLAHRRQIRNTVPVSKTQLPDLAQEFVAAAERLSVAAPQVFVHQEARINAYSFGWDAPQTVVLTSQLVKDLDADELRFVAGRELGHVALGHTKISTLVGSLLGVPRVPILSAFIQPVFQSWSRTAEYSADRAGAIACGRLDKSISALLKLWLGPDLAQRINLDEILNRATDPNGAAAAISAQAGIHLPFFVHRVRNLLAFWEDPTTQPLKQQDNKGIEDHV